MERKYLKSLTPLLATCALSACLGLTGDEQGAYGANADASNALSNTTFDAVETDPTRMPVSGSATYTGYFSANADLDNDSEDFISIIGDAELTVNFSGTSGASAGTLTGTADNFVGEDDAPVTGTLTLAGTYADAELTGTVTGDIEIEEGTVTAEGGFDGTFRGEDAEFFRANVRTGTLSGADTGRWNALITGQR
ncbi:MAG: hypothetical protein AAFQ64_12755 [Pseudomonadota bacterium]